MTDTRHTHYQHASGTPDTVLSYDATGAPELLAKSSLGGSLDIDGLPALGAALDGTELFVTSQGGVESQVDLNTIGAFLGTAGGGGALLDIQVFNAQGAFTYNATAGTDSVVIYATGGGGQGGGSFIGDTGGTGGNTTFDGPSLVQKLLCTGGQGGVPTTGGGAGSVGGTGGLGSITAGLSGVGFVGGSGNAGFSESNTGTNTGYAQGGTGGSSFWGGGGAANSGAPETGRAPGSGGGGVAITAVSPTDNISGGGGGAGGSAMVRLDSDFDGGTVTVGAGGSSGTGGGNGRNGIVVIFEYAAPGGEFDIDSLPTVTTADGGDLLAISDNGTESSISLTNLANALELLGIIGGGGGGGDLTLIDDRTVSGATNVEIVDGIAGVILDNTYDYYELHLIECEGSIDDEALYLRVSNDGGTSFNSGVSSYGWGYSYQDSAGTASVPVRQDGADSNIVISPNNLALGWGNFQNAGFPAEGFNGVIKIWTPGSTRNSHLMRLEFEGIASDGRSVSLQGHARPTAGITNEVINGLQFRMSNGTISGTFKLYGK
jgi:hypothetical protein